MNGWISTLPPPVITARIAIINLPVWIHATVGNVNQIRQRSLKLFFLNMIDSKAMPGLCFDLTRARNDFVSMLSAPVREVIAADPFANCTVR